MMKTAVADLWEQAMTCSSASSFVTSITRRKLENAMIITGDQCQKRAILAVLTTRSWVTTRRWPLTPTMSCGHSVCLDGYTSPRWRKQNWGKVRTERERRSQKYREPTSSNCESSTAKTSNFSNTILTHTKTSSVDQLGNKTMKLYRILFRLHYL